MSIKGTRHREKHCRMTRLVNHLVTVVFQGKISTILSLSLSLYVYTKIQREEDEEKERTTKWDRSSPFENTFIRRKEGKGRAAKISRKRKDRWCMFEKCNGGIKIYNRRIITIVPRFRTLFATRVTTILRRSFFPPLASRSGEEHNKARLPLVVVNIYRWWKEL